MRQTGGGGSREEEIHRLQSQMLRWSLAATSSVWTDWAVGGGEGRLGYLQICH